MNIENREQMMRDSDMIFTQISTGAFDNIEEARRLIVMLYIPDLTISRSGISHALKRLEKFYDNKSDTPTASPDSQS